MNEQIQTTTAGNNTGSLLNLDYGKRRVRVVGDPDNPQWVAVDVCDILGIANSRAAIADFDDDEKGVASIYTLTGKQLMSTVYEAGLYKLIFKSRKAEAKKFQKWVFKEVLPSLRKYGQYPPPQNASYQMSLKPYTSRVVWVMQVRKALKPSYWCVFIEGAEVLIGAEQILGPANLELKQYDLIDGSIGSHWGKYRDDKPWSKSRVPYNYTFPQGDPRGTVRPWSYHMDELQHFKQWLHTEYLATHFPTYLRRKYGESRFQLALPIFASLGVPLVGSGKKPF